LSLCRACSLRDVPSDSDSLSLCQNLLKASRFTLGFCSSARLLISAASSCHLLCSSARFADLDSQYNSSSARC
jgi:hypothetical protein